MNIARLLLNPLALLAASIIAINVAAAVECSNDPEAENACPTDATEQPPEEGE